jgi:MoaA/NifB/PqqE/SkfB family radical SAM enzyme
MSEVESPSSLPEAFDPDIQTIRTVVDTLQRCNFGCTYCHPAETTGKVFLPAAQIRDVLTAAEEMGQLDVSLTGGEIAMHPEWDDILDATAAVSNTGVTLITNGSLIDEAKAAQLADSNVSRICTSIDGSDAATHNYARGNTFDIVMRGLDNLRKTGKNLTVISVVHQGNYQNILNLSHMLASEGLADQHHMCVTTNSGRAREHADKLLFPLEGVLELQRDIDEEFNALRGLGVFVTMNSFWPITGQRPAAGNHREFTAIQLCEQNKNVYGIVRPNGDVNSTVSSWGREFVGSSDVGNLNVYPASVLLDRVDAIYRGEVQQLPRALEARMKFVVSGVFDENKANNVLDNYGAVDRVKAGSIADMDVLQKPMLQAELDMLSARYARNAADYRIVKHASGVYLFYDKSTAHVYLLTAEEHRTLVSHE